MGKKQRKDEAPNPNSVVNREIFQRLNFMYQASVYLKTLDAARSDTSNLKREADHESVKRRRVSLGDLGSSYVRNMRTIGNKAVVRMDPNVKRRLCKGCDTVLVVGITSSVRIKGSPDAGHKLMYTCGSCRTSRVIPAPRVTSTSLSDSASSSGPPPTVTPSVSTFEGLGVLDSEPQRSPPRKKRKLNVTRPLPLFARQDAGHVVFRGNEVANEPKDGQ